MSDVFDTGYADVYDALYHDKDYTAECAVIEDVLRTFREHPVGSILDLGCGTGNHAVPLAKRGYHVVGVDRSKGMLAHARRKADSEGCDGSLAFAHGDVRSLRLKERFDAAVMMFAVLGYQIENADVLATLRTARAHLHSQGLLLLDVWYGPAVLHQRPSQRVKITPTSGGQILRATSGELDVSRHVCSVRYHVWRIEGKRLETETRETHRMRFFFPRELEFFLETAGFSALRIGRFPDYRSDPDESTWNVLVVARAV